MLNEDRHGHQKKMFKEMFYALTMIIIGIFARLRECLMREYESNTNLEDQIVLSTCQLHFARTNGICVKC